MTVSTTKTVKRYTASVTQTVFPYDFRILNESHLSVTSDGVALTLNTDYTVDGVGESTGGNVTLTWEDGAVGGEKITILRNAPATQLFDYVENDAFPAQTHEDALDQLTMIVHQLLEEIDRAPKFGTDSTQVDVEIEEPVAGEFLRWKTGGGVDSTSVLTGVTATGVDVTDTDTTKDKMVSNALAKDWEDLTLVLEPNDVASSVNNLRLSSGATGNNPTFLAQGETNVGINYDAKGTGVHTFNKQVTITSGGLTVTAGGLTVTAGGITVTAGDLVLTAGDITLDGSKAIKSVDTEDLNLTPGTTGNLVLDGVNWPQADGSAFQILKTDGAGQTSWVSPTVIGTEQASTSGTAIDFTGIPANVQKIRVVFDSVSLSGTDHFLVQLGTSGTPETTGYAATGSAASGIINSTSGFPMYSALAAGEASGIMEFVRMNSGAHKWVSSHGARRSSGTAGMVGGGVKTLAGELDMIRITTTGSNTFDNGNINIQYELS